MGHTTYLASAMPAVSRTAVEAFTAHAPALHDPRLKKVEEVLDIVRPDLEGSGWKVAPGGRDKTGPRLATQGTGVAVDARHPDGAALWIETGRSYANFGFLQHVIEAAMSNDTSHAVIAVMDVYSGRIAYDRCRSFLDDMFATSISMPLESVVLLGY